MKKLCLVVLGTMSSNPFAGMAWMHMQIAVGLKRLGHDVYYVETTSAWPYDPRRNMRVCDSEYALPYLVRVVESFGLGDKWAYRRSYLDNEWFGQAGGRAVDLLRNADAVFNVAGATRPAEDHLEVGRLVYYGTDPVIHEVTYQGGNPETEAIVDEHQDVVTYGENIGTEHSPIPPLPRLRARTRQPVLTDLWKAGPPSRDAFTTVGNWKQEGREVRFNGETYLWSKHHEFLKILDLPKRVRSPIELAMNLDDPQTIKHGEGEVVKALGVAPDVQDMLRSHGWLLTEGKTFSMDPWPYRDYIHASSGEFTVARDLNVRLRSGWFSERSACYLAAGRPVITQDTGFGTVLPTGEGLFAFNTMDEILDAFRAVEADYELHSRRAREIADEYFRAETVLSRLLEELDL